MTFAHRRTAPPLLSGTGKWLALLIVAWAHAQAEVQYDGSLGRSGTAGSIMNGGKTDFQILPGDGQLRGSNLFHSFSKFNLSSSEAATFLGPVTVRNILARVTGDSPSSIDGRLSSAIAGANLFFMNPKGIIFGPNATVDVSGSFFATTADYIRLGADGKFAASTNARESVLTTSDPSAFGFLTPNPAAIQINGSQLSGPKTLAFIGGDVTITGAAAVQADDVQIVSVRSTGEAGLQLPASAGRPSINAENFKQHGAVSVTGPALDPDLIVAPAVVQGARVVIRGGTFVLKNTSVQAFTSGPGDAVQVKTSGELLLTDRSSIDAFNFGDMGKSPAIDISAGSVTVEKLSQITTQTGPDGAGGDLRLKAAGSLHLDNEGGILTDSYSLVRGGDLSISADSITVENTSRILSHSNDTGKAGNISLDVANQLALLNEGKVSVQPQSAAGETMTATAGTISVSGGGSAFLFLDTSPDGVGGAISLTSRGAFTIRDGGLVSAQTIGRNGASVNIQAGSLDISGAGVADTLDTGVTAKSAGGLGTHGGEIHLSIAGSLNLLDGGVISTDAFGGGDGGDITISATDATITGRGGMLADPTENPRGITARNRSNSPTEQSGSGGNVHLTLSGSLEISNAGSILADTSGPGAGGSVTISAKKMDVTTVGTVAARTLSDENGGPGGNVSIDISDALNVGADGLISVSTLGSGSAGAISIHGGAVQVSGANARITAVSGTPDVIATGNGGDISMDARQLTLLDRGQITASTYGPGAGGSLRIQADTLRIQDGGGATFTGLGAQTFAPGLGGPGGTVQIQAQSLEMSGAGATITTQSLGAGNGGQIQISAGSVAMSDRSTIQSSSTGAGSAGGMTIDVSGGLTMAGGSSLSVASARSDAGDIAIRSGTSINLADSSISAQAAANGGSIDIRTDHMLFLSNSQVTAAAGVNGGNIFIDPQFVVLENSLISANAIRGRGGNIRIVADYFLSSGSLVTATSELGIDGTVEIDALHNDLTGSLVELPSNLLNAESLLRDLCTVKIDKFSSFVSEGRGGLPPLPGEALPSLMIVP